LFVGAFSKQKGIEVLIKAFNQLDSNLFSLHLVGDGELFDAIKQIAKNNTYFYGRRDDVEDFYLEADLVVVPSVDGEGSSGVIKEAMVAKKIVLASDLEANKELIEDKKTGFLFQNKNASQLKGIIQDIFNKKIELNLDMVEKKSKEFDCKFLIQEYIKSYEEIL